MVLMKIVHSSSAGIKCLVGVNNKKVNGMQKVWDILLKSPLELLKTRDLPYKEVAEKHGLSRLRWFGDQTGRIVPLSSNHNSFSKPQIVKCGADSTLQIVVKRARELSAWAKSPSVAPIAGPGAGDSFAGDEHVNKLPIKSICLCQVGWPHTPS